MGADTLGGTLSIAYPSFGFHTDRRCRLHSRLAPQEDRLGTIDLHYGRAIVPNGSCRRASGGLFGFPAVYPRCRPNSRLAPQEDRLRTIDLHFGRAIVPNGSGLFRNGLLLKSPRFEIRWILLSDLAQEGG
jgi:hypothetical protein